MLPRIPQEHLFTSALAILGSIVSRRALSHAQDLPAYLKIQRGQLPTSHPKNRLENEHSMRFISSIASAFVFLGLFTSVFGVPQGPCHPYSCECPQVAVSRMSYSPSNSMSQTQQIHYYSRRDMHQASIGRGLYSNIRVLDQRRDSWYAMMWFFSDSLLNMCTFRCDEGRRSSHETTSKLSDSEAERSPIRPLRML